MRISKITKLSCVAAIGLGVASVACSWLADINIRKERQALERQAEFRQLGIDLANASDYLTNEARRYTIFGDKKHFDNYWREVKETKTRDRVVERLKALGATQEELDLIEEAKNNSDALIKIEDEAMKAVAASDLNRAQQLMFGSDYDQSKAIITAPIAKFQMMINDRAAQEASDARRSADIMTLVAKIMAIISALSFMTILYFVFSRRVVTPLVRMSEVVSRLAQQDYAVEIPDQGRRDEIGEVAHAVQIFKANGIARLELEAKQAEEHAAKEARARRIDEFTKEFDDAVEGILRSVASAATELDATAHNMSATAEETSRQSTAVAAASEQASQNVQTVAAAAEELSSSVDEIGRRVVESTRIAGTAVAVADRTNLSVKGLAEAAQKIGEVVNLINDIAAQTNLLALNATIEAARAGEAGKGFAVVASEVKSLANQTAKATEDIAAQIGAMQAATGESVGDIEEIGGIIRQISEIAATIASAVEEQGAATQEIARNVQQAAAGTAEVSSNIGGVTQAAGETGAAANQVLSASSDLSKQAEALRSQVQSFLEQVKAA
jgi:methyl-accepting chemotaxis protein